MSNQIIFKARLNRNTVTSTTNVKCNNPANVQPMSLRECQTQDSTTPDTNQLEQKILCFKTNKTNIKGHNQTQNNMTSWYQPPRRHWNTHTHLSPGNLKTLCPDICSYSQTFLGFFGTHFPRSLKTLETRVYPENTNNFSPHIYIWSRCIWQHISSVFFVVKLINLLSIRHPGVKSRRQGNGQIYICVSMCLRVRTCVCMNKEK